MNPRRSHFDSLKTSAELSACYVPNYIKPLRVLAALDAAGIRAVFLGSHAFGGWMQEPRAARETTVLVAAGNHRKAVRGLLAAFPHLGVQVHEIGMKLCDPDPQGIVIDVLKAVQPLLRRVLVQTITVRAGRRSYLIPTAEMALALIFGPMIALSRFDPDKYLHGHDFLCILQANPDLDFKALAAFGELLYKGGGAVLVEKVRRTRAGEKLNLSEGLFPCC